MAKNPKSPGAGWSQAKVPAPTPVPPTEPLKDPFPSVLDLPNVADTGRTVDTDVPYAIKRRGGR
jgi:hypothetical protein